MARGTDLYGFDDSPAATATSSTPSKGVKGVNKVGGKCRDATYESLAVFKI